MVRCSRRTAITACDQLDTRWDPETASRSIAVVRKPVMPITYHRSQCHLSASRQKPASQSAPPEGLTSLTRLLATRYYISRAVVVWEH